MRTNGGNFQKSPSVEQARSETANVETTVRKLTGTERTPERLGKEHSGRNRLPGAWVLGRFTQGNATKRRVEQRRKPETRLREAFVFLALVPLGGRLYFRESFVSGEGGFEGF